MDVVVTPMDVEFGKKGLALEAFNDVANEGKGIVVTDGPFVQVLRYCRNVRPTWVKFDSKDTKESDVVFESSEY